MGNETLVVSQPELIETGMNNEIEQTPLFGDKSPNDD